MRTLADARLFSEVAHILFQLKIAELFPGADEWEWYRAVAHINGENVRRNDDTSKDIMLASNAEISKLHDNYITALHAFYLMRDGPNGFLGGKGL